MPSKTWQAKYQAKPNKQNAKQNLTREVVEKFHVLPPK